MPARSAPEETLFPDDFESVSAPPEPPRPPAWDEGVQVEMSFMASLEPAPPLPEMNLASLEAEAEADEAAAEKVAGESENASSSPGESEPSSPVPPGGSQVKLQLFGRPDEDLSQLTRSHLEKMEGHPAFPSPLPSQAELARLLEAFAQDCRDTRNAMKHVRMLVAQKLKSRRRLEHALNRRGNYVQLESHGDAEIILSTAFEVRRKRQAVQELAPPAEIQAVPGAEAGSMILTWSKVRHAKLYRLEYGPVDGPKIEIPLTGRRRRELTGLEVGRMHSFRIASIGGQSGQSRWSKPVLRMVA